MQSNTSPDSGILERVRDVAMEACAVPAGDHGVGEWMELIAEVSAAISVLNAARDAAVVRLAAIEEIVTEDGVIGEQVNGLGTVCVDAAAMVSTATGVTTRFGQELVEAAVLRVVRVPALHEAMLAGGLDEYRARCVGGELVGVPAALARVVVDALAAEFGSRSGPALRRRAREILSRLAPELLRERIRTARSSAGLRRWSGEPGAQCWGGVFPSERSARAWAAVDALARTYRAEDRYPTLEQARAYALLDLVDGRTSVETVLHVTISADALNEARGTDTCSCDHADCGTTSSGAEDTDGTERGPRSAVAAGAGGSGATGSGAASQGSHASGTRPAAAGARGSDADTQQAHPAGNATTGGPAAGASRPSAAAASASASSIASAASSGGSSSPAVSPASAQASASPLGSVAPGGAFVSPSPDPPECSGGERFVTVLLPGTEFVAWVPVAVLPHREATARWVCDPDTGALLDADNRLASEGYRPGRALRRLVRSRDRRCRFPGCVVPARQCDLDHVVPWPTGPTAASNLMCLCRRHHRIKQRSRWRVRLYPDGVVEWVDPSRRRVRTDPADQLRSGQVQVTDVKAATAEDIAEQREIQALNALYDELTGKEGLDPYEDQDDHDRHHAEPNPRADSRGHPDDKPADDSTPSADEYAGGNSAVEAALAVLVAALNRTLQPPAQAAATDRPRSLGNAFDQNRIPRPSGPRGPGQREDRQCRGSQHGGGGPCGSSGCDHNGSRAHRETRRSDRLSSTPFDVSDLRARHRHFGIRYRPSKRHRRRAAYLAAGDPPF